MIKTRVLRFCVLGAWQCLITEFLGKTRNLLLQAPVAFEREETERKFFK